MLSDSRLELALLLLVWLALLVAVFGVLFVVVRAAVEQGVRRAVPDAALRPHVRELLRSAEDAGAARRPPGP